MKFGLATRDFVDNQNDDEYEKRAGACKVEEQQKKNREYTNINERKK